MIIRLTDLLYSIMTLKIKKNPEPPFLHPELKVWNIIPLTTLIYHVSYIRKMELIGSNTFNTNINNCVDLALMETPAITNISAYWWDKCRKKPRAVKYYILDYLNIHEWLIYTSQSLIYAFSCRNQTLSAQSLLPLVTTIVHQLLKTFAYYQLHNSLISVMTKFS